MRLFFILVFLLFPLLANAESYQVVKEDSTIKFTGVHAGNNFEGQFEKWNAGIMFDANDLASSSVSVNIDMTSAKTGNAMYDGTLPSADWFDVTNHPTATFQSTQFSKTDNGYSAIGDLTIRGINNPINFDFTLEGDYPVVMTATFPINRLDFDIGKESDPSAEWVSEDITLTVNVNAIVISQ